MTSCPYILPEELRPSVGIQTPAYSFPAYGGARMVVSETGSISIGGGGGSDPIDGGFYGQTAWVPGR